MSEMTKLRQFVNDSPLPYTMKNKEKMKEKRFFDAYPEPEIQPEAIPAKEKAESEEPSVPFTERE